MDARIRFYRINKCGYYEKDTRRFGSIAEVLSDLKIWIRDKVLNETKTYSVDPTNNESRRKKW